MHMLSLGAFLLFSLPAVAQSNLLVVDASGGAGSQYRQIQEAVNAANPGDRILIRSGTYRAFRIDGKPLAIVGEPGAALSGFIGVAVTISNIPAGTDCTLSGLQVNTGIPYTAIGVSIRACDGRVSLDTLSTVLGAEIEVVDSPRVAMVRVGSGNGRFALRATDSAVNATSCRFRGVTSFLVNSGNGAVLTRSVVSFAGCDITGMDQIFTSQPRPALWLEDAYVTITDDGSHVVTAGNTQAALPAIVGSGTVAADRRVVIRSMGGAPLTESQVALSVQDYPLLEVARPRAGRPARADLAGVAGAPYALAIGLPADWRFVPGIYGASWLDLSTSFVVQVGALDANGEASATVPVPAGTALVGVPLMWQGVAGQGPVAPPAYSNPVPFITGS